LIVAGLNVRSIRQGGYDAAITPFLLPCWARALSPCPLQIWERVALTPALSHSGRGSNLRRFKQRGVPVKTTVFCGTSVDGFIARLNHTFDFLSAGGEVDGADNGYDAFFATVDALLMGRNTYEVARAFPEWPYGKKPVFVLSHRPLAPAH